MIERYKKFPGRTIDCMPLLLEEGRIPLSIFDIMQGITAISPNRFPDIVRDLYWGYANTGDLAVYDLEGNVKFVPVDPEISEDSLLRKIFLGVDIRDGALVIDAETYSSLQGVEFSKKDVTAHTRRALEKQEVLDNPFWNAFSRNNNQVLQAYVDWVFDRGKFYGFTRAMSIFVDTPSSYTKARLWSVGDSRYYYNSSADSSECMEFDAVEGLLFGVIRT